MEIVIDINEHLYKTIKTLGLVVEDGDAVAVSEGIRNGTPLPKPHGRLVDMSEVLIKLMQFYDGDKTIGQCLDEVNTIIEADKAERSTE
jgi:hypothetical protein